MFVMFCQKVEVDGAAAHPTQVIKIDLFDFWCWQQKN